MYNSKISGLGYYVPDNIVTNNDLSKIMDTTDEWIQERTGIKERRWIDPKTDDTTSTMAVKASKIAIERSGLKKNDIDVIKTGLKAQVRLTAFNQRQIQPIEGRVITVSADHIKDERTGIDYFLARVELTGRLMKG